MMSQRINNLEINDAGAWKRVTSFDLATFEDGWEDWRAAA